MDDISKSITEAINAYNAITLTPETDTEHPRSVPATLSEKERSEKVKTNQDKIKELCGHLGGSLYNCPNDERVLDEQVQILNSLFHTCLAEQLNITKHKYGEKRAMEWIKIALQIQRQCAETLRTRKAIDYMDSLTTVSLNAPKNV